MKRSFGSACAVLMTEGLRRPPSRLRSPEGRRVALWLLHRAVFPLPSWSRGLFRAWLDDRAVLRGLRLWATHADERVRWFALRALTPALKEPAVRATVRRALPTILPARMPALLLRLLRVWNHRDVSFSERRRLWRALGLHSLVQSVFSRPHPVRRRLAPLLSGWLTVEEATALFSGAVADAGLQRDQLDFLTHVGRRLSSLSSVGSAGRSSGRAAAWRSFLARTALDDKHCFQVRLRCLEILARFLPARPAVRAVVTFLDPQRSFFYASAAATLFSAPVLPSPVKRALRRLFDVGVRYGDWALCARVRNLLWRFCEPLCFDAVLRSPAVAPSEKFWLAALCDRSLPPGDRLLLALRFGRRDGFGSFREPALGGASAPRRCCSFRRPRRFQSVPPDAPSLL